MKYFEKYIDVIVDILMASDCDESMIAICGECNIPSCDKDELTELLLSDVPEPTQVTQKEMLELKHMLINRGMFSIHCETTAEREIEYGELRLVRTWVVENNNECEQLSNAYNGLNPTKMYELRSLVECAEVIEDGTVC